MTISSLLFIVLIQLGGTHNKGVTAVHSFNESDHHALVHPRLPTRNGRRTP